MSGHVEQRRAGLPAWGKVGWGGGAAELKMARPPTCHGQACSPERLQRHPPGVLLWTPPSGPVLLATCSKIRDMRSNSIWRKCPSKKGLSGSWGSRGVRAGVQPQGATRELHSWNWTGGRIERRPTVRRPQCGGAGHTGRYAQGSWLELEAPQAELAGENVELSTPQP